MILQKYIFLHSNKFLLMNKYIVFLFLVFSLVFVTYSCSDDLDDQNFSNPTQIKDFVWKALNSYYLWQNDVAGLSDDKLLNGKAYVNYLEGFNSPEDLFEQHLKRTDNTDRFSVIFKDYNELEALLSGTNKTNGVEYGINRISENSNEVFGWVRLILPNSDASSKNINRGDVFYAINGTPLTVSNFRNLLASDSYTLNMANYSNGQITPNNVSVSLTKTPYTENPIYYTNIYQHNEKKIGYIIYNGFNSQFENQLNQVFANFIAQGVTHLAIDLRYNPGGSVSTASRFASMINKTFVGQIFGKQQWNQKVFNYYNSQNNLEIFNTRFPTTTNTGQTINSLNLQHIFFITSKSSASASELLIHNLKQFINVTQIGDVTTGKNVGSILMYDSPNYSDNHSKLNPNHKYVLLPLVFKSADKLGNSNYANGIQPTISYVEDIGNLGVLGEESDPLLHIALEHIRGRSVNLPKQTIFNETLSDTKNILSLPGMIFDEFILLK